MKKSKGEIFFDWVFNIFMLLFLASILYPFVLIISRSFSSDFAIYAGKVVLFPIDFTLNGYATILKYSMLLKSFKNTVVLTILGTFISIVLTAITAYPLSKNYLPARKIIMSFIIFTMFFGGGLIPLFILLRYLKILNSIWALILPITINTFFLILMKSFFLSIPESLEESAKIDGANDFYIFYMIYVPLSLPVLATIILFYSVGYWNTFMSAVFFITDQNKQTLQVMLRDLIFRTQAGLDPTKGPSLDMEYKIPNIEGLKNATIIVSIVPMVCIYPFIQRYFVSGIMIGSIKG